MYHTKALAIFTLDFTAPSIPMKVSSWRECFVEQKAVPTIVADCPIGDNHTVQKSLMKAQFDGLIRWEGPVRSPGSRGNDRRTRFLGYFDAGKVSPLDLRLYVTILRRRPDLQNVLIGSQSLLSDSSAKLVEMTHPQALLSFRELTEEVILVSPSLAAIQTAGSPQQWQDQITEQTLGDPQNAVDKVRFRPSRHGGRVWAQPALLPSAVRHARSTRGATSRARSEAALHSILNINGPLGAQPGALVQLLMSRIAERAQIQLSRSGSGTDLQPGEWREILDTDGQINGRIRVLLRSLNEVERFIAHAHGHSVSVNGEYKLIEVENPHVDFTSLPTTLQDGASMTQGGAPMYLTPMQSQGNGNGDQVHPAAWASTPTPVGLTSGR